ncbi:MAG: protein kinase [Planctomycetota bacterium]
MSVGDLEDRMGQLCEELQLALEAGESIDVGRIAGRFSIPEPEAQKALQALSAMHAALGEEAARAPGLAPPQLSDDYEVRDELGRGGMGIVYRAHQKSLDRDLAVKVLRPGDLLFGDAIHRFEREAKSLAKLRHRHIVSVHEVGKADGFVYFTMDLIDGCTLADRLKSGAMTATQAVKLLVQISSAMAYAHGRGILHRDLKPGNVLLDGQGDAFVCDFGLARELAGGDGDGGGGGGGAATRTGQMMGTPAYMSPEQALGDHDKVGEQSDVYALGAILYECLSGQPPFAGLPLAQLMHAVIEKQPLPLRKRNVRVPPDLETICEKAMQKDPAHRYATVQAFAEDLERFSIGREILARRRSSLERAVRFAGRNRNGILGAVLPVAMALLAVWWFVVPLMRHTHAVEVGAALLAAGNTQGATTIFTELFGQTAPDEIGLSDRTLYLDALTAEAARSYLLDEGDDTTAADALVREATRVVLQASRSRSNLIRAAASDEQRAEFDRARRNVALFGVDIQAAKVPRLQKGAAKTRSDDGPMRHLDALSKLQADAFDPWSNEDRVAMLALLRASHRLPHRVGQALQGVLHAFSPTPYPAYGFIDGAFLDGLAELVGDRTLPRGNREDAARLLHRCWWLPFLFERAGRHDLVVAEEDLEWLTEIWPNVSPNGRAISTGDRVDLVVERLAELPPNQSARQLLNWLQAHTGRAEAQPAAAVAWWRRQRRQGVSVQEVLMQALGWDLATPIDAAAVLERMRQASGGSRSLLHHLLTELAPPGTQLPYGANAPDATLVTRWERALGLIPNAERTMRVAVIGCVDQAREPTILWQSAVPMRGEDRVAFEAPIAHALTFGRFYIGAHRPPEIGTSDGPAALTGSIETTWREGRFELASELRVQNLRHPQAGFPLSREERPQPARYVSELGRAFWVGPDRTSLEFVVLASLRPEGEPTTRWGIGDWRGALGASLQAVAAEPYPAQLHHFQQIGSSLVLPVPEARDALARVDAELAAKLPNYRGDVRRAARLFAGDTAALDTPLAKDADSHGTSPAMWLRLVRTTREKRIRDFAWSQLSAFVDRVPTGGMARAFAAARAEGIALPGALADWDAAAPSPAETYFQRFKSEVVMWGLGILLLLVGLAGVLFGKPSWLADGACWLLIWGGLLASGSYVWLDGIDVFPRIVPLGLATLGVWAACLRSPCGLWGVFAACFWTATAAAVVCDVLPNSSAGWWLAEVILLPVWWLPSNASARRMRQMADAKRAAVPAA